MNLRNALTFSKNKNYPIKLKQVASMFMNVELIPRVYLSCTYITSLSDYIHYLFLTNKHNFSAAILDAHFNLLFTLYQIKMIDRIS